MTRLRKIEGIGTIYEKKLHHVGLYSLEDLLKQGCDREGRKTLSKYSGISNKLILEWINRADLVRVKGIGEEYADLLEHSGVDTVMELRQRNPEQLWMKMRQTNDRKHLVRRLPTLVQVKNWITQAKKLPRVVRY